MGSTKIQQPTPPTPPSAQDEVNAWISALPQVYQTQQQYMLPLAESQQAAQEALYPQTSALQENLAGQAAQGMQSGVPSWMTDQYKSDMNAQLGANAGSPIGADYMSRGLMQQQQNWKQYYQNMGLSLAGRQPLAQPNLDYTSGFTPNSVMAGMNQNYGSYGNLYGNMYGANAQVAGQNPFLSAIGGVTGNVLGGAAGAGKLFGI